MNTEIYINEISRNIYATFAPGKKDKRWNRNIDTDLIILKDKVDVLVCMIPNDELEELQISNIEIKCQEYKIDFYQYPLIDNTVPESIENFNEFINKIHKLTETKKICVFCRGGLGRTGLVCASLLLKQNISPTSAIKLVREKRTRALGRKHQQQFIHNYNKFLQEKKKN